jgi:Ser/Thr protein kinase RdoA (MazF antagonist)
VWMLPDSPSLDYLRRQAKDLLIGLRETRPSASLADAQATLARKYGFHTWPELKAEVDRRRGRANIADAALSETIAKRFRLGTVIAPMRSLARANEVGRPWALDTDAGRWAVKQLNDWFGIENVETDVRLQAAAAQVGILLPPPVPSVSGATVESIEGHNWRVNAWIESGPPIAAPVGAQIAAKAGSILARLHGLALPPEQRMESWHKPLQSEDEWTVLVDRVSAYGMTWASALRRVLPHVVDLRGMAADVEPPAAILCHCALAPSNVRVARDDRLAVLGWEHAGAMSPSWELANVLEAWTVGPFGDPPNVVAARALLDAYRAEVGHLPSLEVSSFSASVSGWLNYVYGQICMALNTSDAEGRGFMDRNVSHLLAHPPRRALYERVLETALAPTRPLPATLPSTTQLVADAGG